MQMDPTGRMCGCGRRGCLEAVASGWALSADAADIVVNEPDGLVARISARENEEPDARILDLAAEQGDAAAIEVLRRAGVFLGAGLTNLIDLFNPEVIVIGGSLRKSDIYYKTALEGARRDAYPQHASDVRIVEAELGDDAPAMGAGLEAWDSCTERGAATSPDDLTAPASSRARERASWRPVWAQRPRLACYRC